MPPDKDLRKRAQQLKSQLNTLQESLGILNEKVNRLRIQRRRNAGGSFGFQIQQELQEAIKEYDAAVVETEFKSRSLEQQLKKIDLDRVYRALLEMDYLEQTDSFESYLGNQRIAAFLIHGEKGYGQDWLLRRLLETIPYGPESEPFNPIMLDLGSTNNKTVAAIWKHIADRALVSQVPPLPNADIAKAAANWLLTHTVVIILRQIDAWTESNVKELLERFWRELVKAAQDTFKQDNPETRLILFLVDYSDNVCKWNVPLHDISSMLHGEPSIPIRLQNVSMFTIEFIKEWLLHPPLDYRELFKDLRSNLEESVEIIMQNSQGVPEEVARHICYCCKLDYDPERWLQI